LTISEKIVNSHWSIVIRHFQIRLCLQLHSVHTNELTIADIFKGSARLGILETTNVHVAESPADLKDMLNKLADQMAIQFKDSPLGEIDTVRKIRAIFHRSGLDPTRYRPSSESLLRRAVKGKGLYLINSVVDLINYWSLKLLWPMGLYDADHIDGPIEWRAGRDGETYEGIGRDRLNLANFPLLSDALGPFGSPISDSMRTRVTEACTHVLWITFAPGGAEIPVDEFAATMKRFCGGEILASRQFDV
jgi:DNA/RNA-binding domain of Phe-tRNA-synthetase-like protein